MRTALLFVVAVVLVGCVIALDPPTPDPGTASEPKPAPVSVSKPNQKPEPPKPDPNAPVDCVLGPWSAWTPWGQWHSVPDFKGWEMRVRVRSRSQVTPAANGGTPCGQLMDAETEFRLAGV